DGGFPGARPQAARFEKATITSECLAAALALDNVGRPIPAVVVGRRVGSEAVEIELDERWPAPRAGALDRRTDDLPDREDVESIHQVAWHPVRDGLDRDRLARTLPLDGNADRVAVVLADEDDGRACHAGQRERAMEVTGRCSAIAKGAGDDR